MRLYKITSAAWENYYGTPADPIDRSYTTTIAQTPEETIKEQDVRDYMQYSGKAIRLLKSVGKRTGIPFNYSFLNDLQVQIAEDIKPIKTFTQFSGEMYGI